MRARRGGIDFSRESLRWVVQQLMEAEVSELIGAEGGEQARKRPLESRSCGGELAAPEPRPH